jgi:hypothetical protein
VPLDVTTAVPLDVTTAVPLKRICSFPLATASISVHAHLLMRA